MDYTERTVLIPAGTTVNGAVVALTELGDADEPVLAELRINGPPVK